MIRAAFLAVGLNLVLLGAGLFFVEKISLNDRVQSVPPVLAPLVDSTAENRLTISPPVWFPYTFVGVGGVTILYAIALPRR